MSLIGVPGLGREVSQVETFLPASHPRQKALEAQHPL
jgi:hypothetical protein